MNHSVLVLTCPLSQALSLHHAHSTLLALELSLTSLHAHSTVLVHCELASSLFTIRSSILLLYSPQLLSCALTTLVARVGVRPIIVV